MSTNVQFRVDEATVQFVQGLGLKVSELARAGLEKEVRKLRAEAWGKAIAAHNVKPFPPGWAARAVREDRDSH